MRKAVDTARGGMKEFCLAGIDMSGRAYCEFGDLPFLPSVAKEDFAARDRYDIDIVILDEAVLLRKNYRGDRAACVREWFNMEPLAGKARVPIVRKADERNAVLYMDYVYGRTILEVLRDNGALMRDTDVEHDPSFADLDEETRQRKLDERGTPLLSRCLEEHVFSELDDLIRAAHECRLTDLDIRFANVLVDDQFKPWLIDFHDAMIIPRWANWIFRIKRQADCVNYQRVFGRNLAAGTLASRPVPQKGAEKSSHFRGIISVMPCR